MNNILRTARRLVTDVTAVLLSFLAGYWICVGLHALGLLERDVPAAGRHLLLGVWFLAVMVAVFWRLGLYAPRTSVLNLWELTTVVQGVVMSSAFFLSLAFILKVPLARSAVLLSLGLALLITAMARRILGALVKRSRLKEGAGRRVIIVGSGEVGRLILKKIVEAPHLHRSIVGFLDDRAPLGSYITCTLDQTTGTTLSRAVLGRPEDLADVARRYGVEEVLVDEAEVGPARLGRLISTARGLRVTVGVVPALEGFRADQLWMEDLSAIPVLRTRTGDRSKSYELSKRLLDMLGATALLIVSTPVWLVVAVLIRLDSPGPVLFRQNRVGLGGRLFEMLKFRTMKRDTEPYSDSPVRDWDPRVTRLGRILRLGGVDELPQLLNVLRGDMSLVGPRPEMPFIVDTYTPLQRRRLQVKPGITGLWQLSPDRHAQIHENIEYDLYYLDHRSFMMDVAILAETALRTVEFIVKGVRQIVKASPTERRRSSPKWRRKATPAAAHAGSQGSVDWRRQRRRPDYVFLALDQRRETGADASWPRWVGGAPWIAQHAPVRILAAESNRGTLDKLLLESSPRTSWHKADVEFVRAAHSGDFDSLVRGALLVITDLHQVSELSRELGRNVLLLFNGKTEFHGNRGAVDAILTEVERLGAAPGEDGLSDETRPDPGTGASLPH